MEIATLFTSKIEIVQYFDTFICSYDKLKLRAKDEDTHYFSMNNDSKRNVIYYHEYGNEIDDEFYYNNDRDDIVFIKHFFNEQLIFYIDISFKFSDLVNQLFVDFKFYLKSTNKVEVENILISGPFTKKIQTLEEFVEV